MALYDIHEINDIIEEEGKRCVEALKAEASRVGIQGHSGGLFSVKCKFLKIDPSGVITRIRFIFPKYGVIVEKGAGRGYGGYKGSKWKTAKGIVVSTNPDSLNKMNSGNRKAKEWFNPVIKNFSERLTERLSKYFISVSYKRLKIK
jgi:hypothetical protein